MELVLFLPQKQGISSLLKSSPETFNIQNPAFSDATSVLLHILYTTKEPYVAKVSHWNSVSLIFLGTPQWQRSVAIFVLLACFQNSAPLVADRPRDGEYFTADTCVTLTSLP
jgi:hypothetical protein